MSVVQFLSLILGTWRLAFMLFREDGPFGMLRKVREQFGVEHDDDGPYSYPEGSVFACLGCLSVWVGAALWFLPKWISGVLSLSAGAILVHALWERLVGASQNDYSPPA